MSHRIFIKCCYIGLYIRICKKIYMNVHSIAHNLWGIQHVVRASENKVSNLFHRYLLLYRFKIKTYRICIHRGCSPCVFFRHKLKHRGTLFFKTSGRVNSIIWMPHLDTDETYREKLDNNYTRMLRAILNKSWEQHPTKQQLYGHLPPISKTI